MGEGVAAAGDFSFKVEVQRPTGSGPTGNEEHNLIQKGQSQTPGGSFKLEWDEGVDKVPTCTFQGSTGGGNVKYRTKPVSAGFFHTIECRKTSSLIEIKVDGDSVTAPITVGTIANDKPLTLGGKPDCGGSIECDYFFGKMNRALIQSGS